MPRAKVSAKSPKTRKFHALFVRHKHGKPLPDWLLTLEDEIVTVLSQDLKITVIEEDFDYGEVCDRDNPDFVIFNSPGCHRSVPLTIANSKARPDIPRIGFLNYGTDPHDTARAVFLRMMDELKIDRFFSIQGAAAMRQSPELMGRVFIAPLYIDGKVFKDYGLEKDIPVSVFGWGVAPNFYNWRTSVVQEIFNYFPTLIYTHPGYGPRENHRFIIEGVDYAKMLNRSRFSIADTTRVDYLVRKHLEIPASGAVLVSSPTSDVFYYGFRDMENCIMGSGMELFQKIARVVNDPELYEAMRKKGHDLVHSRFVYDKWHYMRDWYACQRALRPGETVQQQGVFGPFVAVPGGAELPAVACDPLQDSEFSLGMKDAWQKILAGERMEEAEAALTGMLGWLGHLTEPWMLLGIIALLRGQAARAKEFFLLPYQIRFSRECGNTCFDPEEIAWLNLTGVLMADGGFVQQMRAEASGIRYLGLRRMEWLFQKQMNPDALPPPGVEERQPDDRLTTHWTGQLDIDTWSGLINRIIAANK